MSNLSTCYYPTGEEAPGDNPCHSPSGSQDYSACCGKTDICLDNGLCLYTSGLEAIGRGSCTDEIWRSSECPQYCTDVNPGYGTPIHLVDVDGTSMFCCGNMNPFNKTCLTSTKGNFSPFSVEAGQIIFNRTSGSTLPNSADTVTITTTKTTTAAIAKSMVTKTVTANATITSLSVPSGSIRSPFSSSRKDTAVAAVMSSFLGLALLITLGLLWKQTQQKQRLNKDLQESQIKYAKLMKAKTTNVSGAGQQPPRQLEGRTPNLLDDESHLSARMESLQPREIDGAQIFEADNRKKRA